METEPRSPSVPVVRFGAFEADLRAGELRRDGLKVRVQDQPFRLLKVLLGSPGEVVTREELKEHLWPADTFVDFDNGLNTAVNKLRMALGDSAENPRYVETVGRRGYRLIAPVVVETAAPGPAAAPGQTPAPPARRSRLPPRPLLAALAGGFALAALAPLPWRSRPGPAGVPIRSLAVLPFENLSGDAEQEYFADGMTDALITDLASIGALRVISRQSVMQYKRTRTSLPEIGRELGVEAVVEGSVLRSGDRVRVIAQLVHARDDRHLWARSYERGLGDVLDLQRELARSIARQISISLTADEEARLAPMPLS